MNASADGLSNDGRRLELKLRLSLIEGIGPRLTQALLERFGSEDDLPVWNVDKLPE